MSSTRPKPIALLTDKVPTAVTWAKSHLTNCIYNVSNRTITTPDQDYIIVTTQEQLLSMEISDYKDVGGNSRPSSFFVDLAKMAKTRIR